MEKKHYGYWDREQQNYVETKTYQEAFAKSGGHVKVLDQGKWRGIGLYEIPESAWR